MLHAMPQAPANASKLIRVEFRTKMLQKAFNYNRLKGIRHIIELPQKSFKVDALFNERKNDPPDLFGFLIVPLDNLC